MNIWIINQNAIPPSMGGLSRHYYFSKYLQSLGHSVRILTSSKIHNTNKTMIKDGTLYQEIEVDGIEYTFIRTINYKENGLARILSMLQFPHNLNKVFRLFPTPDIIYASSPPLFSAVNALRVARKIGVPLVAEIRDLWPESIVEYRQISRKNPFIRFMFFLEHWLYRCSDALVFTIEGYRDYILEKGWAKDINFAAVHNINNGVDINEFDEMAEKYLIDDPDLCDTDKFKIVYTGSIRLVNNLMMVVNAAEVLKARGDNRISFLVYGDGTERAFLEEYVQSHNLTNIKFKGRVEKRYIPFVLRSCDVSLIHGKMTDIMRFGSSPNKLFDYLAAGKPILLDLNCNYNLVERHHCGVTISEQSPQAIADAAVRMSQLSAEELNQLGLSARKTALEYDYKDMSAKLEEIFISAIDSYCQRRI